MGYRLKRDLRENSRNSNLSKRTQLEIKDALNIRNKKDLYKDNRTNYFKSLSTEAIGNFMLQSNEPNIAKIYVELENVVSTIAKIKTCI
ncbi:MAG: hypothetical protein AAGJ35_05835 [Myxococcota bacterium]